MPSYSSNLMNMRLRRGMSKEGDTTQDEEQMFPSSMTMSSSRSSLGPSRKCGRLSTSSSWSWSWWRQSGPPFNIASDVLLFSLLLLFWLTLIILCCIDQPGSPSSTSSSSPTSSLFAFISSPLSTPLSALFSSSFQTVQSDRLPSTTTSVDNTDEEDLLSSSSLLDHLMDDSRVRSSLQALMESHLSPLQTELQALSREGLQSIRDDLEKQLRQRVDQQASLQVSTTSKMREEIFANFESVFESLRSRSVEQLDRLEELHQRLRDHEATWERHVGDLRREIERLRQEQTSSIHHQIHPQVSDATEVSKNQLIISSDRVEQLISHELTKYDADKTGKFDFAMESVGGLIMSTRCTQTHDVSMAVYSMFGLPFWWQRSSPRAILQPNTHPGQCWAFKGSQGSVVIKLARAVIVTEVTLEHISPMVAPDNNIDSAPKQFTVHALRALDDSKPWALGNFTYNIDRGTVQTFKVNPLVNPVQLVELTVLSNYGNDEYTCIYRFRVHGHTTVD